MNFTFNVLYFLTLSTFSRMVRSTFLFSFSAIFSSFFPEFFFESVSHIFSIGLHEMKVYLLLLHRVLMIMKIRSKNVVNILLERLRFDYVMIMIIIFGLNFLFFEPRFSFKNNRLFKKVGTSYWRGIFDSS